ncbi:MAG: hypothetical protein ACKVHE_22410 [Planctomycetales bacterium]|jgi:hypothetical protein
MIDERRFCMMFGRMNAKPAKNSRAGTELFFSSAFILSATSALKVSLIKHTSDTVPKARRVCGDAYLLEYRDVVAVWN